MIFLIEENYATVHSDLIKDAEEAREEREVAIAAMEEQYAASEEEMEVEGIGNDDQPL